MPPGVAAAPAPSMRTSVGSITDRPTARQCSAATACASHSVTYVNAFSQSPGCRSAASGSGPQEGSEQRSCGRAAVVPAAAIVEDIGL
jgi:hypothetical protein